MSSFVWYEESSRWFFVHLVRSRAKVELVLVRPVRGFKQAGLRPSGTKSREMKACPRLSSARIQVGKTASVRDEEARKEGMSSSIQYKKSSKRDFVHLVRSRTNGGLVLVRPVRRNQARHTSFVQYEVAQKEGLFLSIRYKESSRWDFVCLV